MKRSLLTMVIALLFSAASFAQLTGVKTIPGDYSSVAAAISALNASGVGTGGVTFNVAAGYSETFTTSLDGTITTLSGSATNPVIFQKSGAGANPVITAAAGIGTLDAIITIAGCDYVTFDGINLTENALNTDPTTFMESGYAILKASGTDGSQNITIKNSTINLKISYVASVGIYSNNHTTANNTQLTVTAATGQNSNLKIYGNTLSNCYSGIYLNGYNDMTAPYSYFDQNNEIGKDGANIITNVAGQATTAGYGIYAKSQNNLKVANNAITSTMGGSGSPSGIYLTSANNASFDVYGNSVSMQYSGGTGTTAYNAIFSDMGAFGNGNTVNIYNNTVSGCTYSTLTTGTVYLMSFINLGTNLNVYGNNVTNNSIGGASVTATGALRYLYCGIASSIITPGPSDFHDNNVSGNTRTQSVAGGGSTHFMYMNGKNSLLNMYNNTVTNNVISSNGGAYLLYAGSDIALQNVYNNTVSNITKAEGQVFGLYSYNVTSSSGDCKIYQNTVKNIEGITANSAIYGFYSSNVSKVYFYNNIISDLRAPISNGTTTSPDRIYGCYFSSSSQSYIGFYNNSVYINNTSTGANFGSNAIFFSGSAVKTDLRNNILVNTSTATGVNGKTNVIKFAFTSFTNFLTSTNYNALYAGTPGPTNCIGFAGSTTTGTSYQTLSNYKAAVYPRELQSVTEMPPFMSTTAGSTNLHLQPSVATQCEAGGFAVTTPIIITTDFDNDPRFPNAGYPVNGAYTPNAPDMGADEIGGIPIDITGPAITYSAFGNTNLTTNRTLEVTITDGHGVPTSGTGLPVLYWKINSGAYQSVQGTWVSGSTYTFSFGAGTTAGDVVYYYVVAQDMVAVPNVSASPAFGASGFSSSPPACSTAPDPSSYTVMQGISGVFHIGVGKDYATLTDAANDINIKFISGPITLLLDDATYPAESFPAPFTSNPGSSATNTLTIRPNAGNSATLTSTTATEILTLNGIDYVVIDGSNNGSNSKNLTISNTKLLAPIAITVMSYQGNNPTTNVTIKNCIIKCIPIHSSVSSATPINFATVGGGHENIIIDNNIIEGAFDAVRIVGTATAPVKNVQVTNNIIGSELDADAVTHIGVYMTYADNTLVSGNDIMGPKSGSLNVGQTGVYMSAGSTNTKIRGNKIHDFYHNSDDGWGATGLWYSSDATTVTEISNNSIYDIKAPGINPGVGQNITYGMFFRSGGNIKILHNSINLTGPWLSTNYDASSACLGFYYQATGGNFEVRNNVLRNGTTYTTAPGPINGRAYGIMISTLPTMFSGLDNNDYFIDGYNSAIGQKYTNGFGIDGIYVTLADWQAYTGKEANSVTTDPAFTSNTNLLPTSVALNNKGLYLSNVLNDITGAMRSNPCDIGAYEFGADPKVITLSNNSVTNSSAVITGSANASGTTLTTYFDYGTTTAYGTSVASSPSSVTGSSNTAIQLSLNGLQPFTTYHYRVRGISSNGMIAYGVDSVFTTMPDPPVVITTAATAVTAYGANLNGSVNANGGTATVTIQYGLTTAYGTTVAATPASVTGLTPTNVLTSISGLTPYTTYHYRVVATNVTGTTNGNDMTFTTQAIPSTVNTLAASDIILTTATLNGSVNANYAPTNVTFEWGETTAYGNTVAATPAQATGTTLTSFSAPITGLLTGGVVYHFRCVGNGPGGTVYGNDMVFTSDCPTPALPGTISGPTSLCKNTMGVPYSVAPVSGASGYNWILPTGATIASGANTNSITVDFSASVVNGVITVAGTNSCGSGSLSSQAITFYELPVPSVNGLASTCQNTSGIVYTTEAGMTNYIWTVTGGTITAGAGTNSITVTWNTTGAQTVNVNYANSNGCSAATPVAYPVTVLALPVPTISGANVACESSAYLDYTTEPGMTNYVWDMTANSGTITQSSTNTTTIFWTASGAKWVSVSYTGSNGCTAVPAIYNVTVNPLPGTPGTINGQSTVCAGTNSVAYSVAAVANAATYIWAVPAGATIATGSGTTSITVNYSTTATSGNVSVFAQNTCGDGQASLLPVTVNTLPLAAGVINGVTTLCQGTNGVSFSVAAITGATSYNWTVPAGATIVSGSGSNSITVDFGMNATSGNISVSGTNACGSGTASTLAVTVNIKPATPVITQDLNILTSSAANGNQWYRDGILISGAVSQTYTILEDGTYNVVVTLNGCSSDVSNSIVVIHTSITAPDVETVTVYPNPSRGEFWLAINSAGAEVYEMEVMNSFGAIVYKANNLEVNGTFKQNFDLHELSSGMYTLVLRSGSKQIIKKIVINK